MRILLIVILVSSGALSGCLHTGNPGPRTQIASAATFSVPDADLPDPLVFIAYGDMRFTNPSETIASHPAVRRALVTKVAAEHPAAVFINGDLPWHGVPEDYDVYRQETQLWRDQHLRIYPALGNHEFEQCEEPTCLENWWNQFPELRGRRWYSVALGSKVLGIALDTDTSLLPGSEQRLWLENQISALQSQVRFVLILMHHPPLADEQAVMLSSHNPRPNEKILADYLSQIASGMRAQIVVSSAHIHNYERFAHNGVTYLVSGGGGAQPYPVERGAADLYQNKDFPNFHYVRFALHDNRLVGEMIRVADPTAAVPSHWETKDHFEANAR